MKPAHPNVIEPATPARRTALAWAAPALALLAIVGFGLIGHQWLIGQEPAAVSGIEGSDRWRVSVSTDKPIYREGETVYFRAVVLNAFDNKPLDAQKNRLALGLKVLGPKGDQVMQGMAEINASSAGASWDIPGGQPGGIYKVIFCSDGPFAPAERSFEIRAYRAPKLRAQLEFVSKAYGPGDTVTINAKVTRAEGGIPTGATVTAIARVDGEECHRSPATISPDGVVSASYSLPATISKGEGTHTFVIEDGGVMESFSKTIPILLQSLDVQVFPEGGDLVAGVQNGLYVQAKTPWGDPADFAADIVDDQGKLCGTVATEHEGRGRTLLLPAAGRKYQLRVTKPSGITTRVDLPEVKATGAVLRASKTAYQSGEGVTFTVAATKADDYRLSLFRHEREVSAVFASLEPGTDQTLTLSPPSDISGVLRATLFDGDGKPVAERLVYRAPVFGLKVEIAADREVYTPGDQVNLTIRTMDHRGKPVAAVVGVTVTDDAVLEMVEQRRKAPRLPAMVLLESDVDRLEDATIYLDGTDKGNLAVDLLLGTQGWRRFAHVDAKAFMDKHGDAAKRALAFTRWPEPVQVVTAWFGGAGGGGGIRRLDDVDGAPAAEDENAEADRGGIRPAAANGPLGVPPGATKGGERPREPGNAEPAAKNDAKELGDMEAPEAGKDDGPRDRRMADTADRARRRPAVQPAMLTIREYAHMLRAGRKPGERRDFSETLYWNAGIQTSPEGQAQVTFFLSDSITSFRVMADAYSPRGLLGSGDLLVESKQPFAVEPKLPLEVTVGDLVELPVALVNNLASSLQYNLTPAFGTAFRIEHADGSTPAAPAYAAQLAPLSRSLVTIPLRVVAGAGSYEFTLSAEAGPYSDTVTRSITVQPYGFPTHRGGGGMLKADGAKHTITIPDSVVPGSVTTSIQVYPTPLANLTAALERLIREPYGCFEQASSVVYPMVMAQQYFKTHLGVEPALVARANDMIDKGYKKLAGYEVPGGGFEWFGGAPAHEALTAYGVLEFHDMAKVYPVEEALLERTRKWLLERRDGNGGFQRNPRALDSFGGAPQNITNAYIVWSLTESGYSKLLDKEVEALFQESKTSKDPYFNGLVAAALHNAGRRGEALDIMKSLTQHQHKDGSVVDATTSITRSSGDALTIETTSVAVLAWLKDDQFTDRTERAMNWLATRCQDGRFGSTQSTILALKAIVAYDAARAAPRQPGELVLRVNGAPVGSIPFTTDTKGALLLPDFASMLAPGKHEIELAMLGGSPMPYSVHIGYHADTPASSPACPVTVSTRIDGTPVHLGTPRLNAGETCDVRVKITNTTAQGQPMTTAIIGLPGGLEPRHDQLRELVEAKVIDFYEVRGREVVVYLRSMAPNASVDFRIDCTAAIPGTYTGPASRTYLYYGDEHKHWVHGMKVTITGK